jgi:acyl-homoserine lactone acylase PvdQ
VRRLATLIAVTLATGLLPAAASAQVDPGGYRENDHLGFRNILPPGSNGRLTATELTSYATVGAPPANSSDQLAMYGDLVYETPGLEPGDLERFFKDASFGVAPGDVARSYSPRADVTIVRDRSFGVPHIYGSGRAGAMFGAGYVAAEDRLFFIDVLRHIGRAQLSSFAGGARGNRDLDAEQWQIAPYTEADFQRQIDQFDDLYGADGRQLQLDVAEYAKGINAFIDAIRQDPSEMPAEYAAINRPQGPEDWRETDVIAVAALVGGIFGKGGGGELRSTAVLQAAERRFGARRGRAVWADFRTAEDAETPTTVHRRRFPYHAPARRTNRRSIAIPDPGTLVPHQISTSPSGGSSSEGGALDGLLDGAFPAASSNSLVVSARESETGRPIAVFGPQTGYFAPQILMEQDIHAPAVDGQAGIDARGVAFPGTNLFVQLGRGRDYAWSATSAGQDIVDTFALALCEPDGSAPTLESMHYRFRGACEPIEVMRTSNSWQPSAADQTPAGSETLVAHRTRLGLEVARAELRGRPVMYVQLRSTYMHEVDSAPGFMALNAPERMRDARDFQRAMHRVGYTFNWFYVDERQVAYFNSGNNPVRARGTDPSFPVRGEYAWRGWDPERWTARYEPFSRHPRTIDQAWLADWNNKQAHGYQAADNNWSYGPVHRVDSLRRRIAAGTRGRRKMSLVELVEAMEEAGTVDLRAREVLPWALRVLGRQRDPELRAAIERLEAWLAAGAQRRDRDRDDVYEHADAIRILDAWWPRWIEAQFEPVLGEELYREIQGVMGLDNEPNNHGAHLGSAYLGGWYGYASKDLRKVLGRRVRGRWSRAYCGRGSLERCRRALADSLREAAAVPASEVYAGDSVCGGQAAIGPEDPRRRPNDQWCFDAVWHRPLGALNQPLIHWINRPTFQQVVEVRSHRPR